MVVIGGDSELLTSSPSSVAGECCPCVQAFRKSNYCFDDKYYSCTCKKHCTVLNRDTLGGGDNDTHIHRYVYCMTDEYQLTVVTKVLTSNY